LTAKYFNARWYDPGLGRFYSLDPAGQGTNPYAYAGNNPITNVDPLGLWVSPGSVDLMPMDREDDTEIFYYWNYDEYGNLLNVEYYNAWGVEDPLHLTDFGGWHAHPAYMWTSGNINFAEKVSYAIREFVMRTLYLAALYGGKEGRDAVVGYKGSFISVWNRLPGDAVGITIRFKNVSRPLILFSSKYLKDPREFTDTIIHEGLHGYDPSEYYDRYVHTISTIFRNVGSVIQATNAVISRMTLPSLIEYFSPSRIGWWRRNTRFYWWGGGGN